VCPHSADPIEIDPFDPLKSVLIKPFLGCRKILVKEIGFMTNGTSCRNPWVVNVESMNNFKGNLDHYLRDNIGDLKKLS